MEEERIEYERMRTRNIELETRLRHIEGHLESKEKELMKVGVPESAFCSQKINICNFFWGN